MELMLIMSLIILILGIVCFISIRMNISKSKSTRELKSKLDILENMVLDNSEFENKKTEIRNKYNEQENNIDNSTTVDNGIMPNNSRTHNHDFNKPCGEGCPSYNRK